MVSMAIARYVNIQLKDIHTTDRTEPFNLDNLGNASLCVLTGIFKINRV